jgi:hypothetical protein
MSFQTYSYVFKFIIVGDSSNEIYSLLIMWLIMLIYLIGVGKSCLLL